MRKLQTHFRAVALFTLWLLCLCCAKAAPLDCAILPGTYGNASPLLPNLPHLHTNHYDVRIQAVRLADDDGSRRCPIEPAEVTEQVKFANAVYSYAGITFLFDPLTDFSDVKRTLLNKMTGVEDPDWAEAMAEGNRVAASYPWKMLLLYRAGPGPGGSTRGQSWPGGFSWWDYSFVAMNRVGDVTPNYIPKSQYRLLAHEIGHHLGLPHTFGGLFNTIEDAAADLAARGNNPFIYDGDGFSDTPPHPSIRTMEQYGPPTFSLNGIQFTAPRTNIMSYYWEANSITSQQADRAILMLKKYLLNGVQAASHKSLSNVIEGESMTVESSQSIGYYGVQDMTGFFGAHNPWSAGKQIFLGFEPGGAVTLLFSVPQTATYEIGAFGTLAPDFGLMQFSIDGVFLGSLYDAYAPVVWTTGRIDLGQISLTAGVHRLKIEVAGKNPLSTRYSFGLDCIQLKNLDLVEGPSIQTPPLSQWLQAGQTATLNVAATGTQPLFYRWRKNGEYIPDANDSTLTIANAQPTDSGVYWVEVSNSANTATTTAAALTVVPNANPLRMEGEDLWTENDPAAAGLGIQDMAGFGPSWSVNRQLFIALPAFQSLSFRVPVNRESRYHLDAVFTAAPDFGKFQCRLDDEPTAMEIDLYSATVRPTQKFRIATEQLIAGVHELKIQSTGKNSLSSGYLAGLDYIELTDASLTITNQPTSQVASEGDEVRLSVGVESDLPLTYQWKRNGSPLFNATGATLIIPDVSPGYAGYYEVEVRNEITSLTSNRANLAVISRSAPDAAGIKNGHFRFVITGPPSAQFSIESSSDLKQWIPKATMPFPFIQFEFIDPNPATNQFQFYRVRL